MALVPQIAINPEMPESRAKCGSQCYGSLIGLNRPS